MTETIHAKGALAKLHICGNITPLLSQIASPKDNIVDVDWMVDFGKAAQTLHGISAVCGNFDPVAVLLQGNTQKIQTAVQ